MPPPGEQAFLRRERRGTVVLSCFDYRVRLCRSRCGLTGTGIFGVGLAGDIRLVSREGKALRVYLPFPLTTEPRDVAAGYEAPTDGVRLLRQAWVTSGNAEV